MEIWALGKEVEMKRMRSVCQSFPSWILPHDGVQICESLSQEIHINALYERTAERCSSVLILCHDIKISAYPENPNRIIHSSIN